MGAGAAEKPTELSRGSWWGVLKRSVKGFQEDGLTDWAAALTYYAVLSIFPALIVLMAILGLVGQSATQPLIDNIGALAPGPAREIALDAIKNITANSGAAGVALIAGIAAALWAASGYIGAFSRASNAIYEVEEGRPFWKLRPLQMVLTTVMIIALALCAVAVVVTGPLARRVGDVIGVGSAAVTAWDIAKWPVIALVVISIFAMLYWAAPNVRHTGFRWITPGGLLAVILWVVVSAAFALYVANFSAYNRTYGSLAGPIVFLVWLWLTNLAVLLGAEFNAELERGRELEAGTRPERTLALEPRDGPG